MTWPPHPRTAAVFAALFGFSCSDGVQLPVEMGPGDVAVVVSTVDGRAVARTIGFASGKALEVPSDPDRPIFTWVVPRDVQVNVDGTPLDSSSALATMQARLLPDLPDPSGATAACGRCANPTVAAPLIVTPGDTCPLPTFLPGAVWQAEGGKYSCEGSSGSRICPEGSLAAQAEIEEVRRQLRLDRPGACACRPRPAQTLAGLQIRAISPPDNPVPLSVFAQNEAGQVLGVGEHGALLWDAATSASTFLDIEDWQLSLKQIAALRSGSFIVTGEVFNSGALDEQAFFRFDVTEQGLVGPVEVQPSVPALPQRMRYLGDASQDFPLYLIGGVREALGIAPAVFACTDDRLACQQVNFRDCPRREDFTRIEDATISGNGFGLAVSGGNALYYKTPNPAGQPNPAPNDEWRCDQPEGQYTGPDAEDPPVSMARFVTIGQAGDRLFTCAHAKVPDCEPWFPVILTATAGASDPEWRVAHRGPNYAGCGAFLPRPTGTRLVLGGARLVDFDADGAVTWTGSVFDRYGPLNGYGSLNPLQGDWVVATGTENRAFVGTSSRALSPIYGGSERIRRIFRAAVVLPDGNFLVFGESAQLVQVNLQRSNGRLVDVTVSAEEEAGLLADASLYGAAIDITRPEPPWRIVVSGEREGAAFMARFDYGPDGMQDLTPISVPADVPALRRIVSDVRGGFVVYSSDTRLFALDGDDLTEIEMVWDDPRTEEVEVRPTDPIDGCSGRARPLDRFRGITANDRTFWATGTNGTLFRATPISPSRWRAERFGIPDETLATSVMAACPGEALVAGRGRKVDLGGVEQVILQFFGLADEAEPRRGETPETPLDPRRQAFLPEHEAEVDTVNVLDIRLAIPKDLLPDGEGPGAGVGVVLNNGLIHRVGSGQGLKYVRVPFRPDFSTSHPGGYVLFGADNRRLALGVPASAQP